MKSSTQEGLLEYLNTAPRQLAPIRLAKRRFPLENISAVLDEDTGKLMEYRKIIRKPKYQQFYRNSYANEIGCLTQGMPGLVEGTNTIFFYRQARYPLQQV